MKKTMVTLGFVLTGLLGSSQSKQVMMYREAIAANAVYVQYLKKAIAIARTGLTLIGDVRNGEFNLHNLFFKELGAVNPRVRNWSKVADIISYQASIVKSYKSSYARLRASNQFSESEMSYISSVFSKLLDDCVATIEMLSGVLTGGDYTMTDDERIKRIEMLYANMQSNYKFCQTFSNNNVVMAMQRLKESSEASRSKKLFELK